MSVNLMLSITLLMLVLTEPPRPYPHWNFQFVENEVYKEQIIESEELETSLQKFRADHPDAFLKRVCKDYYYYSCGYEYPTGVK